MQCKRLLLPLALVGALGLALPPASAAAGPVFRDVPPGYWAGAAIAHMARAGLLTGYPDGTFRPDRPLTGAEVVALTDRLILGADAPSPAGRPWYAGDLAAAAAHGWISPAFVPTASASREEAVALLGDAFVGAGGQTLPPWSDAASISAWARPGVAAAAAAGLAEGRPDGRFDPRARLTRAEGAVLFDRALRQVFVHGGRRFRVVDRLSLVASAYGSGEPGIGTTTATGTPVRVGEAAVDPSTIPLGSYLWVTGYDSSYLPADGVLEHAEDTGGTIRGDRIDLYVSGPAAAYRDFGLQAVSALLLAPLS
jgi:3D (Asp-Asp-Asp) domain-containing protein